MKTDQPVVVSREDRLQALWRAHGRFSGVENNGPLPASRTDSRRLYGMMLDELDRLATRDGAVERLREGLRRALVAADNLHCELEAHQENTGEDLEPEDQAVVHGALQDMAFARALLAEPAEGEEA